MDHVVQRAGQVKGGRDVTDDQREVSTVEDRCQHAPRLVLVAHQTQHGDTRVVAVVEGQQGVHRVRRQHAIGTGDEHGGAVEPVPGQDTADDLVDVAGDDRAQAGRSKAHAHIPEIWRFSMISKNARQT